MLSKTKEIVRPLELVTYDPTRKEYVVGMEGAQFLASLKKPFGVVTIVGTYRSGKSTFLNHLIPILSPGTVYEPFEIGHTTNSCTKGIFIMNRIFESKKNQNHSEEEASSSSSSSSSQPFVLIDTEGLYSLDESATHHTIIFTLAVLISSRFLYNSKEKIDERTMGDLSLIVEIAKKIGTKTSQEYVNNNFPELVWLLRDVSLKLVDMKNNPISPNEYLELALKPSTTTATTTMESVGHKRKRIEQTSKEDIDDITTISDSVSKPHPTTTTTTTTTAASMSTPSMSPQDETRNTLRTVFKKRVCFLFGRPCAEENLQRLMELHENEFRMEYLTQLRQFAMFLMKNPRNKIFCGKPISGKQLMCLLEEWVKSVNRQEIPTIENHWTMIAKMGIKEAMEETKENINQIFMTLIQQIETRPIFPSLMNQILKDMELKALESFDNTTFNDRSFVLKEEKKLIDYLKIQGDGCKQRNNKILEKLLDDAVTNMEKKLEHMDISTMASSASSFSSSSSSSLSSSSFLGTSSESPSSSSSMSDNSSSQHQTQNQITTSMTQIEQTCLETLTKTLLTHSRTLASYPTVKHLFKSFLETANSGTYICRNLELFWLSKINVIKSRFIDNLYKKWKEHLDSLVAERVTLMETSKQREIQIEKLQKDAEQLRQECQQYNLELSKLGVELKSTATELEHAQIALTQRDREAEEFKKQINQDAALNLEFQQLKDTYKVLQDRYDVDIKRLQEQEQRTQQEIAHLEASFQQAFEQLEKERTLITQENLRFKHESTELNTQLEEWKRNQKELEQENQKLIQTHSKLEYELSETKTRFDLIQKDCNQRILIETQKYTEMMSKYSDERLQSALRINALENEVSKFKNTTSHWESKFNKCLTEKQQLQEQQRTKENDSYALHGAEVKISFLNKELTAKMTKNEELTKELDSLKSQVISLETELRLLRKHPSFFSSRNT